MLKYYYTGFSLMGYDPTINDYREFANLEDYKEFLEDSERA